MPDTGIDPKTNRPYGSSTVKGSRAGESFARSKTPEEQEDEAAESEYATQQKATGIAGAARRASPDYKKGLAAYKAGRKKRAGATGADAEAALAQQ